MSNYQNNNQLSNFQNINQLSDCHNNNQLSNCQNINQLSNCQNNNQLSNCQNINQLSNCQNNNQLSNCQNNNQLQPVRMITSCQTPNILVKSFTCQNIPLFSASASLIDQKLSENFIQGETSLNVTGPGILRMCSTIF